MADPLYSSADYTAAMMALLPRGRIWPRDPGTVQGSLISGLAAAGGRLDGAAQSLLEDAFPSTAVGLLPEWESALGLPDPCAGPDPILSQRQAQVVARFADSGGQSVPFFIAFAATLGFDITVTEYAPATFGQSVFGAPMYSEDWIFVWQVNATINTQAFSRFGSAVFGDPYSAWGNQVLECEIGARAPAHTLVLFNYAG